MPWAIEYPLMGDDLLAVTRREIDQLRSVAADMAGRCRIPSSPKKRRA